MPVVKVKGGWKPYAGSPHKPTTKAKAEKQLARIKIEQKKRGKK